MKLFVALSLLLALIAYASAQSTAACTASSANAIFTTQLIQTVTGVTTVTINVTNLTPQPVYYVQFAIDDANKNNVIVPVTTSGTYTGYYTWDISVVNTRGTSTPGLDWLRFTPASGNTGVTCNGGTCAQNQMALNQANWPSEIFTFQVDDYMPTFPWTWQLVAGSTYSTFGPLDMSLCYCGNCDAGYFQRDVLPCNLGYVDAAGNYDDTSTPLSESFFNENIILYSFTINGNWIEMFYSDEHPLMIGIDSIQVANGTWYNYPALVPQTNSVPSCAYGNPTVAIGSPIFDPTNPVANVDANGPAFGCTNDPPNFYCPRPMPPSLFITDITADASSRSGDFQFGGKPYMANKVCGLWKTATKTGLSQNSDGTWTSTVTVGPDPSGGGNSVNGITWNLGAGSDPLPFIPGFSTTVQIYGAEIAWDINQLGLNPAHNYRFQFMVHDGDQSHDGYTGGDVGEACIIATSACPPGFTGSTCTQCDLIPAPYDGSYTWYCYPTLNSSNPYNLLKIPESKLTQAPYVNSGGFVPGKTLVDGEGYNITCNCQRITVPCPQSCCGNGICFNQNGSCACSAPPSGFTSTAKTCCLVALPPPPAPIGTPPAPPQAPSPPAIPPCYNNGTFCSGHGTCSNNVCICQADAAGNNYTGSTCGTAVVPPPITCSTVNVSSCDACFAANTAIGLNCVWCTDTTNVGTLLTNGTCVSATSNNCPVNNTLSACTVPSVVIPPLCPDNCTGNGQCVKVTNSTPASAIAAYGPGANVTKYCLCNPNYSGINCGAYNFASTTVIIAGAIGVAAIVGIVVGIVVCLGLAGGGTYAMYTKVGADDLGEVNNNPIFKGNEISGVNPLHKL